MRPYILDKVARDAATARSAAMASSMASVSNVYSNKSIARAFSKEEVAYLVGASKKLEDDAE